MLSEGVNKKFRKSCEKFRNFRYGWPEDFLSKVRKKEELEIKKKEEEKIEEKRYLD